jgi:hypothetical protein
MVKFFFHYCTDEKPSKGDEGQDVPTLYDATRLSPAGRRKSPKRVALPPVKVASTDETASIDSLTVNLPRRR